MYRRPLAITVILLALALVGSAAALGESPPAANTYTGTLTVIVGDPMPVAGEPMTPVPPIFTLTLADGGELRLLPGAAGENDLLRLAGQQVSVTLPAAEAESALATDDPAAPGVHVASAALAPGAVMVSPEVSGNTKWLSIACKFADIADEPKPPSYFTTMYANSYPGLDNYWREASYGAINLVGSTAVGWYTLPQPMSAYQIDDTHIQWNSLMFDCATLAAPAVNLGDYAGINLILNGMPGCCAWGGNRTMTLDGVTKNWAVTWLPPFAYSDLGYVQHEMTHAYGILWHSYMDTNAYGDPWDVVSNAYTLGDGDPVYGQVGQHTQTYHRRYLGWLPEGRIITLTGDGPHTVTLERATQPGASGYLMAVVPIDGSSSHYYAIEARQKVGFDRNLYQPSIVIHEIGGQYPAELMDPGDFWGGFVWQVGATWVAPHGGVTVHVDAATAGGYTVTVTTGLATETRVLTPTADTYVDHETPGANYGGSAILKVKSSFSDYPLAKATFLRFDPTPLPADVARARLRLYVVADAPGPRYPRVNPFRETYGNSTTPWTESGATWNNMWPPTYDALEVYQPSAQDGYWLEWDIAGFLKLVGPDVFRSLILDNFSATFSSREGANPPQLIIEYLVPPDEPTTHTFTPTNDATVNQAKPKLISGSKPTLQVKDAAKDLNAYVKFNVTGLDGAVQSATLRLWATNGGPDGGRVYATSPFYPGTTTQWLETGLKWSNAPAISGAPLDAAGAVAAKHWIELDVTGAVVGNGRASFALTNDSTDLIVYSSKEGVHAPELVIVTD